MFETVAYISRYWFVFVILVILIGLIIVSVGEYRRKRKAKTAKENAEFEEYEEEHEYSEEYIEEYSNEYEKAPEKREIKSFITKGSAGIIIFLMCLFVLSAFTLLTFANESFDINAIALGLGICFAIVVLYLVLKKIYPSVDRFTFIIPMFLTAIGLVLQYRLSQEYGVKQFIWFGVGIVAMFIAIEVIRRIKSFGKLNYLFATVCLGLLCSTLIFSRSIGGAKNWLEIAGFSIQPSEFGKILFIIVSAYFFSNKRKPRVFMPYVIFSVVSVLILVVAKDLGAALLYALTFIVMLYAATGKKLLTLGAVGTMGVGAVIAYYLFPHVKTRVDIWQDPWAVHQDSGYQIVQGLMAIASGSFLGMGLTLGYPSVIPAARTDFIFAVVCEEFGIIFGIAVIAFYLLIIIRGAIIALNAKTMFDQLLVFGVTAMLSLQCFIIIGGVIKLIPLTGITLPFLSYGGSSMVSCMILLGIMQGVAIKSEARQ